MRTLLFEYQFLTKDSIRIGLRFRKHVINRDKKELCIRFKADNLKINRFILGKFLSYNLT